MIADHKHFQEQQRSVPSQAQKKPIKVVMSNEEHHLTRRSYQDTNARKKEQESNNSNNQNSNNNNNNNNNLNNNTKAYFGSPVPMFGGAFPCGSPFYPGPPTPPMEDWPDREPDDGNDVEFVDDERNFSSHEAKRFHQQHQQQQGLVIFPCEYPQLDDYLSASSSDDDDDEVCRLMFMASSVANGNNNASNSNNNNNNNNSNNNNNNSTTTENITNSINTRSRTIQRFGQQVQGQVTSSGRGQTSEARDQTGVQHGRVHKKFRAIDVTSVGNQRPSLNFRKMRRSSFHRKHHRLTDRLSNQIQIALSTSM